MKVGQDYLSSYYARKGKDDPDAKGGSKNPRPNATPAPLLRLRRRDDISPSGVTNSNFPSPVGSPATPAVAFRWKRLSCPRFYCLRPHERSNRRPCPQILSPFPHWHTSSVHREYLVVDFKSAGVHPFPSASPQRESTSLWTHPGFHKNVGFHLDWRVVRLRPEPHPPARSWLLAISFA